MTVSVLNDMDSDDMEGLNATVKKKRDGSYVQDATVSVTIFKDGDV